jgi:hypothetical protein
MILGMSVAAFTALHVAISLVAIIAGLLLLPALLNSERAGKLTALFLATTILTSVTGFFFHSKAIGPPHVVGAISLVVLAMALIALYGRKLAGGWRATYVVCALVALYLNCFVGMVQAFQKVPALNVFAPKGTEPPFAATQGALLIAFIVLGVFAVKRYRPAPPAVA